MNLFLPKKRRYLSLTYHLTLLWNVFKSIFSVFKSSTLQMVKLIYLDLNKQPCSLLNLLSIHIHCSIHVSGTNVDHIYCTSNADFICQLQTNVQGFNVAKLNNPTLVTHYNKLVFRWILSLCAACTRQYRSTDKPKVTLCPNWCLWM